MMLLNKKYNPLLFNEIRNPDTMKKNICYLLALFFLLSMSDANALEPIGGVANQGYDAGAFNKMEMQQINGYQLEKSYIHSLEDSLMEGVSREEKEVMQRALVKMLYNLEKTERKRV